MKADWKKELLASKIDPAIIDLNFTYLSGDNALERLLYALGGDARTNTGKLRTYWLNKYSHVLEGGWWASGINLTTREDDEWGQFKPNQPRGRKYESPPDGGTGLFALRVNQPIADRIGKRYNCDLSADSFWEQIIDDGKIPIIVTEGAKKAASLLSAGYCAVAVQGISCGFTSGPVRSLIEPLSLLATGNRRFYFAFDQDAKYNTRQAVKQNLLITGKLLEEAKSSAWVIGWDIGDGKGVDDLIANKGEIHFHSRYRDAISLYDYQLDNISQIKRINEAQLLELLAIEFGQRLRWNDLTNEPELDGKPFELTDDLRFWFAEEYRVRIPKVDLYDGFVYCAKKNRFNPVEEYLGQVEKTATPINIDNLATRFLGTNTPLYDVFVKKTMIAAVARVLRPGCKVDTALILQGEQGQKKSTFFRVLGGEWFNDSVKDIEPKDALQVLHRCWIQELGEFDRITGKKAAATIKHFLSASEDMFRKPYGREPVNYPRRFVMVGSVNKDSFLIDETGNRRFWVIPLPKKPFIIPIEQVVAERDGLWAGAIAAFRAGETWYLNEAQDMQLEQSNDEFVDEDPWDYMIAAYCGNWSRVSVSEILCDCLKLDIHLQTKATQMRVGHILKRLGWEKRSYREGSKVVRGWVNPRTFLEVDHIGGNGGNGGYNLCPEQVLSVTTSNIGGEQSIKVVTDEGSGNSVTTLSNPKIEGGYKGSNNTKSLDSKGSKDCVTTLPPVTTNFPTLEKSKTTKKLKKTGRDRDALLGEVGFWSEAIGWSVEQLKAFAKLKTGLETSKEMTDGQLSDFVGEIKSQCNEPRLKWGDRVQCLKTYATGSISSLGLTKSKVQWETGGEGVSLNLDLIVLFEEKPHAHES